MNFLSYNHVIGVRFDLNSPHMALSSGFFPANRHPLGPVRFAAPPQSKLLSSMVLPSGPFSAGHPVRPVGPAGHLVPRGTLPFVTSAPDVGPEKTHLMEVAASGPFPAGHPVKPGQWY